MAPTSTIRLRRSAAQKHALAQLERQIRASDPHCRRKYLREFAEVFRSYESVLEPEPLSELLSAADVVLVGDYHALPAAQRYAAGLVRQLAASGRPVVLGLEMVFARDQHILDEWARGQVEESELRERIRFDLDWGYDWRPYYELLEAGRRHALRIYGLDCLPRNELRKIATRDRHAADKLAEIRERHPEARTLVLFGESHLAPNHLPALVRSRRPEDRLLTVLQNVDPLYWRAAGERRDRVAAVSVSSGVVCVFTATPLEKYESYRQCLDRWGQERASRPDLAPSVYNLIEALLRFLNIDRYAAQNHTQPRFLVDMLPEVYCRETEDLPRVLLRKGLAEDEVRRVQAHVEKRGSCYLAAMNSIFVAGWQMAYGAEEAARFVHHACRASLGENGAAHDDGPEDLFYSRVVEAALAYFGSRILCPDRPPARESDLYALYAQPREQIEEQTFYTYREYMEMVDFLVLHKDYEANHRHYHAVPPLMLQGLQYRGAKADYAARRLGYILGSDLYDAYIGGRVAKRFLRSLFFRKLDAPGAARAAYYAAVRKVGKRRSSLAFSS